MLQEICQDFQDFFENHRFCDFQRVWDHFWWTSLGEKMPQGNRKVFRKIDLKNSNFRKFFDCLLEVGRCDDIRTVLVFELQYLLRGASLKGIPFPIIENKISNFVCTCRDFEELGRRESLDYNSKKVVLREN